LIFTESRPKFPAHAGLRVINPIRRKLIYSLALLKIGIGFAPSYAMEIRAEFQRFFSVSDIIPPVTAHEYRGYIISAWARPELTNVLSEGRPVPQEMSSQVQPERRKLP
jgi:hypothetical protein